MAKTCINEKLLSYVNTKRLTNNNEITFNVLSHLEDCNRINAKNYITGTTVDNIRYNPLIRPDSAFECMQPCVNSGTLYLEGETGGDAVYIHEADSTKYANGVITFYVNPLTATDMSVTVTVSSEADFSKADVYVRELDFSHKDTKGFIPVFVKLTDVPTSVIPETTGGWEYGARTFIKITVNKAFALSSIGVFDSILQFNNNEVVKIKCLSEISSEVTAEVTDATCWDVSYTEDKPNIEVSLTGRQVTPNYTLLNPYYGAGTNLTAGEPVTIEHTVVASEDGSYGMVRIYDAYQDECGYITSELSGPCDLEKAKLTRIAIPYQTEINPDYFTLQHNPDGTTDFFYHKDLIGMKVKIAYNRKVDVEELVANPDNLGAVKVRMTYKEEQSDGNKYLYVYDNVLVTSFPMTINEEETEFSFTLSIQPDADGNYFKRQRIL